MIKSLIFWPAWWYSEGLGVVIKQGAMFLWSKWQSLHLGVWMRFVLTPMFGTRDRVSRAISLVIRLVEIVGRGIIWLVMAAGVVLMWGGWLLAPPLIVMLIIGQLK
jgi:hypothetical protein